MNCPLRNIVVVGGGVIAWWAVVFLKKTNPSLNITLVHTSASDVYVETSEPDFSYLLKLIGLSAQDLLLYADGNYYCSQAYFDWTADAQNYFHSTTVSDLDYDIASYNQWLTKLKQAGKSVKVDDYLLASAAARIGKIVFSDKQKILDAGLSFDAAKFVELLVAYAKKLQINVFNSEVKQVFLAEDGAIESILILDDTRITGDFFIDVTGSEAKLLGSTLQVEYESWLPYLPCNRKKTLKSKPRSERLIPFTAVQLGASGWVKNIPLRSQLISEFVFHDGVEAIDEQDAMLQLFAKSNAQVLAPGMRKKSWYKNCLAIGHAAVTFDHFSHSSLYVAAVSLKRFIEFWPGSLEVKPVENEFNRLMALEYHSIRDFHCLHYALAKKTNSPFGRLLKDIQLPDSLRYRINLFGACGHALTEESTLIHASQWTNVFLGFGFWPKTYDYMIAHIAVEEIERWSSTAKATVQKSIEKAPDYTRYMATQIPAA
jgi:tryptophan halogenase